MFVRTVSNRRGRNASTPSPDASLQLADDIDALQKGLARLPEAEREVIMLRHFTDLSFAEIASTMGTPLGTALARAHRGLAKLREFMDVGENRVQAT